MDCKSIKMYNETRGLVNKAVIFKVKLRYVGDKNNY